MGGYESGRHVFGSPKDTVGDCMILSANKLAQAGLLRAGQCADHTLTWIHHWTGERALTAQCEVNTLDQDPPSVRLRYVLSRPAAVLDYHVVLTTTPLPWGRDRWWFVCPLTTNGHACGRRVGMLYRPPGRRYFGCRHCHQLTYQSTRECHAPFRFDFFKHRPEEGADYRLIVR